MMVTSAQLQYSKGQRLPPDSCNGILAYICEDAIFGHPPWRGRGGTPKSCTMDIHCISCLALVVSLKVLAHVYEVISICHSHILRVSLTGISQLTIGPSTETLWKYIIVYLALRIFSPAAGPW